MRDIRFRAWDRRNKEMLTMTISVNNGKFDIQPGEMEVYKEPDAGELMQFTGLLDKNGKEIYELCELNNRYIVTYEAPSFVLYEIKTGDIMPLDEQFKFTITEEYKPLPQDSKGSIN